MKSKLQLMSLVVVLTIMSASALGQMGSNMGSTSQFDGKWLHRVPDEDHARTNPLAHQPQAAAAGKALFAQNCAKCHGADANGRNTGGSRPSLRSPRIRHATDGDLAWMLQHGNPYKGMPSWSSLPEEQRWQIIAYLRTLPPTSTGAKP